MSKSETLRNVNRLAVFNTVRSMNWNFGRGDLLRLDWTSLSGGYAVIKPHQMREERVPFSLDPNDNGKVYIHYKGRKRLYRPDAD